MKMRNKEKEKKLKPQKELKLGKPLEKRETKMTAIRSGGIFGAK